MTFKAQQPVRLLPQDFVFVSTYFVVLAERIDLRLNFVGMLDRV